VQSIVMALPRPGCGGAANGSGRSSPTFDSTDKFARKSGSQSTIGSGSLDHVQVTLFRKSMDPLPSKAISSVPELANRTPFAFIVDSLLVRATDYSVDHRDR
jgi:hypothetical protein